MFNSIIRKVLLTIPLLLLVSVIMFSVINMLPGNAAMVMLGDLGGSVEQLEQLEDKLGLTDPLYVQYFRWLKNFLSGNLGSSMLTGQEVAKRIQERLPVTLELIGFSILLAVLIGIPVGIICAVRRNKPIDYILSTVSMVGVGMPQFWIGILFVLLFSVKLGWLPASGFTKFSVDAVKNLRVMLMPSVTLALSLAAPIARQTRSAILDTLNQDYILTARAKGQSEVKIYLVHALRNALVPVITAITSQINSMIGGVFVIETLFLLPGMGKSMVDAIFQRDYPIVMGIAMIVVMCIVAINLITDILYIFIDPRISLGKK
ncbi:MAG: ABC transporter permease [Oscillospiraceae bacterium]|nr:ABC transporter permease [Oscillospiraceae bacterium]